MASYNNFQSDNFKHTNPYSRTNIYNPDFVSFVKTNEKEVSSFETNLHKWIEVVSFFRWFPDLFYDMITPETGGIKLDLDQRVLLRAMARFFSVYGIFPRGFSKTMLEVMSLYHTAIFYPDIEISMTAQTKENAASLIEEKHRELIKFYPLLKNEITKASFSKDTVSIEFTSGSRVGTLANAQSTKGARRKRLNVEESALLDDELFQEVLLPVVNIPRRTIGKQAVVNPEELNGQINFFTTSGFRGSSEFERNINMVKSMANLEGQFVLGAGWQLAEHYNRGELKSQILKKKETMSPIAFAQNYECKWPGSADGSLVNINNLINCRTLKDAELKGDIHDEYYIGMDVARSESDSNNQSSIVVVKVKRNSKLRIVKCQVVNIINLPNGLSFNAQTIELKRYKKLYNARIVVVDANGLGSAIIDEALKDTIDPITGENLGCWDTINTENEPEGNNAEKCLYALQAQGINTDIIINFIDMVESAKLQLLEKRSDSGYDVNDKEYFEVNILPHIQTDLLIEEVSNLKLKQLSNGRYTVEKLIRKIDKDRYSALAYILWYIKTFEDDYVLDDNDDDIDDFLLIN